MEQDRLFFVLDCKSPIIELLPSRPKNKTMPNTNEKPLRTSSSSSNHQNHQNHQNRQIVKSSNRQIAKSIKSIKSMKTHQNHQNHQIAKSIKIIKSMETHHQNPPRTHLALPISPSNRPLTSTTQSSSSSFAICASRCAADMSRHWTQGRR